VDAVIANRVFEDDGDEWRRQWAATQRTVMNEVATSFEPLPILTARYQAFEPVGAAALASLGGILYGKSDPLAGAVRDELMRVWRENADYLMGLRLPLIDRDSLELARVGDELVVSVSGRRRLFALPSAFRRCQVTGACIEGDEVQVRFRPDPESFARTEAHP
jgi:arsenite-transporting ATPase